MKLILLICIVTLITTKANGEVPLYVKDYLIEVLNKVPDTSEEWKQAGNGGYVYRFTFDKPLAASPVVMISTSLQCEYSAGYWRVARKDESGNYQLLKTPFFAGVDPFIYAPAKNAPVFDIFKVIKPQRDAMPQVASEDERTKYIFTRYHIGERDVEELDTFVTREQYDDFVNLNKIARITLDFEAMRLDDLISDPNAHWVTLKPDRGDRRPSNYGGLNGYIRPDAGLGLEQRREAITPSAVVKALKSKLIPIKR